MRFLHSADLHLDSPLRSQALRNPDLAATLRSATRSALARIVDAAITHQVDALLLAGDIFDSGVIDVTSRAALAAELGRLGRAGIPAVLIRGNHDALLDMERFGPVAENAVLLSADNPTFQIGQAAIHGLGFTARHTSGSMLPQYPAPIPGLINVGLMHTSLGGAEGHDRYAPCAEADLLAHGYDYWALGHIHQRFERRSGRALAVMPGIPQGRSIREDGNGTATLVEIDQNGVRATEVPIALLTFRRAEVDLAGSETQAGQIAALSTALRGLSKSEGKVAVRLVLRHAGALAGSTAFARALADEAAEQVDDIHVEAVRFAPDAARTDSGVLSEMAALMAQDAATPGFRDEAAMLLDDWRKALPREIADVLALENLDDLLAEGLETVIARLSAEGGAA